MPMCVCVRVSLRTAAVWVCVDIMSTYRAPLFRIQEHKHLLFMFKYALLLSQTENTFDSW